MIVHTYVDCYIIENKLLTISFHLGLRFSTLCHDYSTVLKSICFATLVSFSYNDDDKLRLHIALQLQ